MARARSPDSIKAEQMYHDGMKLVEIAKELNVPEGTVRRWKSTHGWDDKTSGKSGKKANVRNEKKSERSDKRKANVRKSGAPKGNKNAAGHKGVNTFQPGHKLSEKHGAYSSVYWDMIDDDEKELIDTMPEDCEESLILTIQLYSVRERRIMKAINKYRTQEEQDVLFEKTRNESKRIFDTEEEEDRYKQITEKKIKLGSRLPGNPYDLQTTTENKDNLILRLEKELTSVQRAKNKAIDSLINLRSEKLKLDGVNKGNDVVRAWADAVIKARSDTDG